jgi:para-aminobenzoate synthetase
MIEGMLEPAAYFSQIAARHQRCFWLDGGGARGWSGNRSMIGWLDADDISITYHAAAKEVRLHQGGHYQVIGDSIFTVLGEQLALGDERDHWVGYFGYAARPDLSARPDPLLPDAVWMHTRNLKFFSHPQKRELQISQGNTPTPQTSWSGYNAAFAQVQAQLLAGNSYEVNLTYREDVANPLPPLAAYLRLRQLNPAPYAGFLQHDVPGAGGWLLSSSPERYAVINAARILETKPIKGTTARGSTPQQDAALREHLTADAKYRAENLMIVDLLRNDLAMVCLPGTVTVPGLMEVESYTSVHQLVSTVCGQLRPEVSTIEALYALFPAGSMTGAPKLRTMQIIDQVEATPRGVYAGAFGWICADGRADLGVVIRSLMTTGNGVYRLGTGGGITVQSDCAEEHAESVLKADRLRSVFN